MITTRHDLFVALVAVVVSATLAAPLHASQSLIRWYKMGEEEGGTNNSPVGFVPDSQLTRRISSLSICRLSTRRRIARSPVAPMEVAELVSSLTVRNRSTWQADRSIGPRIQTSAKRTLACTI